MAEEITRILDIEVKYGDAIAKIAEYREAVAQVDLQEQKLQRQLEEGEITHKEYLKSMSALKIERKEYTDQIRILNKEVSNEIKKNEENQGSLKALRAELSNLTKQYDEMSRAEREGAAGKELQEHIMQVSNEIKQAEYATNRYYRNVGNYPKEVIAMIRDTTIATGSLKQGLVAGGQAAASMGKQLLKLMANPIVAFFAAIAAVVLSVVKAFNNSEERTNRLKQAFSAFEPIINGVKNAFGALADGVMAVIEVVTGAAEKLLELGADFLNFIGIQNDYNEKVAESKKLEEDRQEAIKKTREFEAEEAEAELEVAKQRDIVAQKDKYTREERLAALNKAIKIEQDIADERKAIAQANYENLVREANQTENDAQKNEMLARAKRDLALADKEYYDSTRRLQQQRANFEEEAAKEDEDKRKKEADEAKRKADEAKRRAQEAANRRKQEAAQKEADEKDARQKEMKALQDAEDAMLALVEDGYEKQIAQATIKGQREIDALKERLATEKNLTETAREAINQTIIAKEQELQNTLRDLQAQQQYELEHAGDAEIAAQRERLQAQLEAERAYYEEQVRLADEAAKQKLDFATQVFGDLTSIAEQFADNNKAMAKLAKILALGEIAINTGKAIAAGVAQAQSVPFPANIGAITTTVATVLANMGTAISTVKSAKFAHGGTVEGHATGGYISGPGTGTSDSITARLSNGESVNTAMATSMFGPVLSAMNQMGGGVPINGGGQSQLGEAMLARAVAKGVAMMPRPVVSVEEINATSHRVEVIESLATL